MAAFGHALLHRDRARVPHPQRLHERDDGADRRPAPVVPPFITLSGEVGFDTSGAVTVFAGPKITAGVDGLSPSVAAKEGLFITVGKEGLRDVGGKAEIKRSMAVAPGVNANYKEGEFVISVMPGPTPPPPPGPLPVFQGTVR